MRRYCDGDEARDREDGSLGGGPTLGPAARGGGGALQREGGAEQAVPPLVARATPGLQCSWTRGEGSNPSPPRGPPSWGPKLFGIFDASTQGVPPSYPLSHPISFLPPIPPPSLPFPPSIVDCTRHAPADGPLCSVCPQGGGRASCAP